MIYSKKEGFRFLVRKIEVCISAEYTLSGILKKISII